MIKYVDYGETRLCKRENEQKSYYGGETVRGVRLPQEKWLYGTK